MPTTDRFFEIYGAVTLDLIAYVDEEVKAKRLSSYERDWFIEGLVKGFIGEYKTWSVPSNPDIDRYLDRFERSNSDLRLAAHVFLHVAYDLPRVICQSFDAYPSVRASGRSAFVRPGPRFLKQFLQQMRKGAFGWTARLVGRVDAAQALGYWLVALRSVAWIHGEVLADLDPYAREDAIKRMAKGLDDAAVEALKHRWIFGIEHLDNGQLTAAIPVLERSLTSGETAAIVAATASAAIGVAVVLRRRNIGRIDALGAFVHRGVARALDAHLREGQQFA